MKMNQEEYEKIIDGINSLTKLKAKIKYYSSEHILSMGRDYVKDAEYLKAQIVFDELGKINELKDVSDLYQHIIFSLSSLKFREIVRSIGYDSEAITKSTIYCMVKSTSMYADKELSKEDLFTIEGAIDRIPFSKLTIKNRIEFERIYYGFKSYNLDVFLEDTIKNNIKD